MTSRPRVVSTTARTIFLTVVAVLAGCSEESPADTESIAEIRLTPESPTTDVGLSVQFEATALDADGNVVPGITFSWSSSRLDVATISDAGIATAIAVGTSAITASAGSATPGSQVLIVEPDDCTTRVDVVLDPGDFQTYPGSSCLFLPTGTTGDRYRVVLSRPKLIADPNDVPNVSLRVDPIFTTVELAGEEPIAAGYVPAAQATARPLADRAGLDGSVFLRDARIREHTRRFHAELRRRDMELALRLPARLPARPARAPAAAGPGLVDPPDRDELFLVLQCTSSASRTPVQLVNFNEHVAIYQDSVERLTSPLSQSATQLMLDYWDDHVQQLITDYWGPTPDIDGNERVLLTTSNALPDSAAAGVFSGDFRPTADCQNSNEGEIMYFSTDVINEIDGVDPSYLALSVMAHEVKHVTSLHNSVARGTFHDLWIEEGTAEISQTMSSRAALASIGGPGVDAVITGDDILDAVDANGGEVPPELWGVISEIADVVIHFNSQPNSTITNPAGAAEFHTFYAGGWHFHRFLGDAFGNAASAPFADAPLFKQMTDSVSPGGVSAPQAATGRTFEQLFEDLVVAMAFNDVGPTPARAFTTWDFASATSIFVSPPEVAPPGAYPFAATRSHTTGNPARNLTTAATYSCPPQLVGDDYQAPAEGQLCAIGPSGIRFHEFVSSGAGAGAQVRAFGMPDGDITVMRIN